MAVVTASGEEEVLDSGLSCGGGKSKEACGGACQITSIPEVMSNKCFKCKNKAQIKSRSDKYCKSCFLDITEHEFKAALRTNVGVRYHDKVLVAYSGGLNSSALLHLAYRSIDPSAPRRMGVEIGVVHVNESPILNLPESDSAEFQSAVRAKVEAYGLPFFCANLEDVFELHPELNSAASASAAAEDGITSPLQKLQALFASASHATERDDLAEFFRMKLILQIARREGYQKVMFGDSATRTAWRIFSATCKGRGLSLPLDLRYIDNRSDIPVLRPVKDFLAKETAFYCYWTQSLPSSSAVVGYRGNKSGSIHLLIEDFLAKLQNNFSSTIHTILRTAEKLKVPQPPVTDSPYCPLCNGFRESSVQSEFGLDESMNQVNSTLAASSLFSGSQSTSSQFANSLNGVICFGCRRLLENSASSLPDLLPEYVKSFVSQIPPSTRTQREVMREAIAEYILDESAVDE
eukprot:GILJ01009724.1.p1 GENE.GILJ01009724.1~~GILJ01009724.1.p1  ORF type:complete len:463 (+),score=67.97 GILJ01009724.1:56-1444(+)